MLALASAFFLLNLPSVLVTMLVGPLLLGVQLHFHPLLLLIIPFCSLPLAGVGALLALTGRTPQESGNLTFLLTLLMTGLGPVVAPPDHLPGFLVVLGRLSPATYAASALRRVHFRIGANLFRSADRRIGAWHIANSEKHVGNIRP